MKKTKKIIGIILILVILLGVIFGVLYLKTSVLDFMKSPKNLFFKYAGKMFEGIYDEEDKEKLETYENVSYIMNSKISWELEAKDDKDVQEILDIANDFTLDIELKNDAEGKKSSADFDVKYDKESLARLLCIFDMSDTEKLSVALPDIMNEFISIENSNLTDLLETLGIDSAGIPDKLEFNTDIDYKELMLSDEELKEIKDRYLNVIKDSIDESNFERTKETIEINGEDIKATAYTLTLSEKETIKLLVEVLKELKNDDVILDYIMKLYEVGTEAYASESIEEIKKSDLKKLIAVLIEEVEATETGKEKLKITIYENKGKTVRTKLSISDVSVVIDKTTDKDETNISISLLDRKDTVLEVDIKIVENDDRTETTISLNADEMYEEVTAEIKIITNKDNTYNKVEFVLDTEEIYIKFTIQTDIEYKDVSIEKIKTDNVLNKMTEEEMMELIERFGEEILSYYEDNKALNKLMTLIPELEEMFLEVQEEITEIEEVEETEGVVETI